MRRCTPLQATEHDSHRRLVILLDVHALVHSNPRSSSFSPQQAAGYTNKMNLVHQALLMKGGRHPYHYSNIMLPIPQYSCSAG